MLFRVFPKGIPLNTPFPGKLPASPGRVVQYGCEIDIRDGVFKIGHKSMSAKCTRFQKKKFPQQPITCLRDSEDLT